MNNRPRILLVDDERIVRTCIRRVLEDDYDDEVIEAGSISEATRLFLETPNLSAIISDYQIKDGDGLAFYDWVRKRSTIPFLLISGSSTPSIQGKPGLGFLFKPFKGRQLHEKLNGLIDETTLAIR